VVTLLAAGCQKVVDDASYVTPADTGTDASQRVVDIYVPPESARTADMPVVMWVHGGGFTGGCEEAPGHPQACPPDESYESIWSPLDYLNQAPENCVSPDQWCASVVVSVRYRLAGTPIPDADDADGDGDVTELRPARHHDLVRDVDAAVRWIRGGGLQAEIPDVDIDTNKLVGWGWSAGANLLGYQALGTSGPEGVPAERPNRLILFSGPHSFDDPETRAMMQLWVPDMYAQLFGCPPGATTPETEPSCRDAVIQATTAQPANGPHFDGYPETLLVHGVLDPDPPPGDLPPGDNFVPVAEARKLLYGLAAAGVERHYFEEAGMSHAMLDADGEVAYPEPTVAAMIRDWP
jgi:acetyl esterase/lipase